MRTNLTLGTAKVDITPLRPVPLAGFMQRTGHFCGISRPLYARILFFEQEDTAEQKRSALLVSADIIWWGPEWIEGMRRRLAERWGIQESFVILHATHTHSAPQTSHRFTPSLGEPDPDYIEMLESRVFQGIEAAAGRLEPVFLERGRGKCHFGVHRRKFVDGRIDMLPNDSGPTDPEVNVVRFRTEDGRTKALLVHFTCHPTTTEDNFVSSEFPGVAMELIENGLGPDAVAAFLQGCCGDVRPALVREGQFYRGSEKEVRQLGCTLAKEVMRVLHQPMESLVSCNLTGKTVSIPLPFQELPTMAELEQARHQPSIAGEWGRLLLQEPERIRSSIPFEMTWLKLAEGLSLLAMNAEIVVEYGLFVKRQFAGAVLPVPYSNGMIGYVPTARQVAEGGYESQESFFYFGLPAPFDAAVETKICEAILNLVKGKCP
jgi:hypothetical protein